MSGNSKNSGRFRTLLAAAGLAVVLGACSTPVDSEAALDMPPVQEAAPVEEVVEGQPLAPAVIGMVKLGSGQTLEQAAAATGGTVIRDQQQRGLSAAAVSGEGSIGFLAFDAIPMSSQMQGASDFEITFEPNQDRFTTSANLVEVSGSDLELQGRSTVWAEGSSKVWADGRSTVWADGRSTVWADGRSTVWADGRSTVWADGQFSWMPENTSVWRQIELRDGHNEARRLGLGVVVAVIDTGVDTEHPALSEALSPLGWNFVDNNNDPSEAGAHEDPSFGHGTVVAGIVRQIAPRATILPIRALDADGSGDVINVVRAVYYAVDSGADIINLSLGGPEESPALSEAVRYANSQGVFVTVTAGNDNRSELNFPGRIASERSLEFVISVTSVDRRDSKSSFSNYGSEAEIAAPGENIFGPYPDLGLASWSGTSMAAPQVAGALALALGEGRKLDVRKNRLARAMFEESDDDIYDKGGNRYKRGEQLGAGRLDIEEFLDEVLD